MKSAKRYLLIALTFAVASIIFGVFTPPVVHALLQVMNTPSNPIPTQPVHAKQAVYLACQTQLPSGDTGSDADVCSLFDSSLHSTTRGPAYIVPLGKRLVVDSVSGEASVPSGEAVNATLTTNGTVNNHLSDVPTQHDAWCRECRCRGHSGISRGVRWPTLTPAHTSPSLVGETQD